MIYAVEMVRAEVAVGMAMREEVPHHLQLGVGDSDQGSLFATMGSQAFVECCRIGALGARGGPGDFGHQAFDPGIAAVAFAGAALASTGVVAGAQASPGSQVARAGEAAHIGADFSDQSAGGGAVEARHLHQQRRRPFKRGHVTFRSPAPLRRYVVPGWPATRSTAATKSGGAAAPALPAPPSIRSAYCASGRALVPPAPPDPARLRSAPESWTGRTPPACSTPRYRASRWRLRAPCGCGCPPARTRAPGWCACGTGRATRAPPTAAQSWPRAIHAAANSPATRNRP